MVRQMRNGKRRYAGLFAVSVVATFVLMTGLVWAQSARSTIHGAVKDESGAAVPGVTVTLSSPALQIGQIAVVSEADGNYRVGELPAGLYRIAFELPGFKAYVLSDFRLTIGFVARVDATMAVGGLEETVTVTGAESRRGYDVDDDQRQPHAGNTRVNADRPRVAAVVCDDPRCDDEPRRRR